MNKKNNNFYNSYIFEIFLPHLAGVTLYDLASVIDDFESASYGFGVPNGIVHTGLVVKFYYF